MARISEDDIRKVREATDLVQLVAERVVLNQKGRLFWGCCPFHNEKTPSFKIDPSTQLWHCFGCGKGGDVFGYMMESENLEFPEAVRMLADRAHIEITETDGSGFGRNQKMRMMEACKAAEDFYHMQLMRSREAGATSARAYLHERGFGSEPSKVWGLGFAPGHGKLVQHLQSLGFTRDEMIQANLAFASKTGRLVDRFYDRVMFPVHDMQGRTIAFGGRVIGKGEPKYLNTSETPVFHKSSNMFGIDHAKSAIVQQSCAVVVEGYTDVIAMHEAGLNNVVATLGTALTSQHVRMLSRYASTIVYLFDGDAAGQKAADRASEFIDWSSAVESSRNPVELKVTVLPGGLDPAEFIAANGADAMKEQIAGAQPLLSFSITRRLDSFDLSKPEQKARAMESALAILYPLKDSVSATDYVNLIADRLNLDYTTVFQALKEIKAPATARREPDEEPASEQGMQTMSASALKVMADDEKFANMERELVALIVTDCSILGELGKELVRIEWADKASQDMADALLAVEHNATPAQAFAAVQSVCPQAPNLLSRAMGESEAGEEAHVRARLLVRMLKERDLQRKVRNAKARMRDDANLTTAEMDALFEETVRLQRELAALRNATVADGRTS